MSEATGELRERLLAEAREHVQTAEWQDAQSFIAGVEFVCASLAAVVAEARTEQREADAQIAERQFHPTRMPNRRASDEPD